MKSLGIDLFDGHCDTVLVSLLNGGGFARNGGHLDLERVGKYRRYAQFFALYGEPEDFPGPLSFREIFDREYALFRREMEANAEAVAPCTTAAEAEAAFAAGKAAAFLSVEGAELLDCSLERLEEEIGFKLFDRSRNLTDEQFTAIIDHNGVAGLNLYADFLGEAPDVDTMIAHLDHWLELGGAKHIALGGDLDGCSALPAGSPHRMPPSVTAPVRNISQ